MDPADEQELRDHRIDIVETLEPRDIIHNLYEDGILSEGEVSTLGPDGTQTRKERCRSLLDILPRRGPKAFPSFIFALHESGNSSLAVKLRLDFDRSIEFDHSENHKPCGTCKPYLPAVRQRGTGFSDLLVQNCCLLLQIDPIDFLDDFFQVGIFGEYECQLIRSSVTRFGKCKPFYHELCQRESNRVLPVFQKALKRQRKYNFIHDALNESLERKLNNQRECIPVPVVIPEHGKDFNKKDRCMACNGKSTDDKINNRISRKRRYYHSEEVPPITTENALYRRHDVYDRQTQPMCDTNHPDRNVICPVFVNPLSLFIEAVESKHKRNVYHKLSRLVSNGLFDEYQNYFSEMCCKYHNDPDMYSMLLYVRSSRHAFVYQYREAKVDIKMALSMALSRNILNPCSLQVELLAALARMYVSRKKFSKLEHVLDQAKMIVKSDPNRCKGVPSGWLFFNNARYLLAKMAICSVRRVDTYCWLKDQVLQSLNIAVANFVEDLGDDGLFGLGCSFCLMAITLLCCGENGMTMEVDQLKPNHADINLAGQLLSRVDGDKIPIPNALKALFMLAKCDYFYRKNDLKQAIECACEVQAIAESCDMTEFVEQATVRLENLVRKEECRNRCREQRQVEEDNLCFADVSDFEMSGD